MALLDRKTPGVYVTELNAFPPSVVGVETAIPAFIGHTEFADISGKPVYNQPIKIGSMADFISIFGKGFKPIYEIKDAAADAAEKGDYDFKVYDSETEKTNYYLLTQTGTSQFNLYNSMRLFYANGGGTCYVVSVGDYTAGGTALRGVSVAEDKLLTGLAAIAEQVGPTMLVAPEAILLANDGAEETPWKSSKYQKIVRAMLEQCGSLQDRVAILDVYGSQYAQKENLDAIVEQFHLDVGDKSLSYGMSYFPFMETTVVPVSDFNYMNISEPSGKLTEILSWENTNLYGKETSRSKAVQADINKIANTTVEPDLTTLNQNLMASLPLLTNILNVIVSKNDQLPSSAAMAGVFTYTDTNKGVWNAPANIALSAVNRPSYKLTADQQSDLNVPVNGKAIDALREFPGRGTVVWGARTLDGNSNDWRYIQVRRTLIYIEQSIKSAMDPYVFAANDGNTWVKVTSMVSAFLQSLWSRGGLMGATASEAFTVQCGLGSTMTPQNILDGYMIVQVTVQMIRPAEFIELTFKQQMQGMS
jgi:phage tail sheath protein FI